METITNDTIFVVDELSTIRARIDKLDKLFFRRKQSDVFHKLYKKGIKILPCVEEVIKEWNPNKEYLVFIDKISCFCLFKSEEDMNSIMSEVFPNWVEVVKYVDKIKGNGCTQLANFILVLPGKEVNPAVTIHVSCNPTYTMVIFAKIMIVFKKGYTKLILKNMEDNGDEIPHLMICVHNKPTFTINVDSRVDNIEKILLSKLNEKRSKEVKFIKRLAYTNNTIEL
jgi:hypothetical protein